MNPVKVKNIEIGTGLPKICVPIVGKTKEEILNAAREIRLVSPDVVEWRADWYEDIFDWTKTEELLVQLCLELKGLPLLFTFRTLKEGGEKEIGIEVYTRLNENVIKTGKADLVDVELSVGDAVVEGLIREAHSYGAKVVVSNHDFSETPAKEEMLSRLIKMQSLGADIPKIAVMPSNVKDVLLLLEVTDEMVSNHPDTPIITMSMAGRGVISRLCGEVFGSAMTFGAVGKVSAPGQMAASDLRIVLELLHETL